MLHLQRPGGVVDKHHVDTILAWRQAVVLDEAVVTDERGGIQAGRNRERHCRRRRLSDDESTIGSLGIQDHVARGIPWEFVSERLDVAGGCCSEPVQQAPPVEADETGLACDDLVLPEPDAVTPALIFRNSFDPFSGGDTGIMFMPSVSTIDTGVRSPSNATGGCKLSSNESRVSARETDQRWAGRHSNLAGSVLDDCNHHTRLGLSPGLRAWHAEGEHQVSAPGKNRARRHGRTPRSAR